MPQPNKILTYGLADRVRELSAIPGMTDIRIAEALNEKLLALTPPDAVSASAVSRFRRAIRGEMLAETKTVIAETKAQAAGHFKDAFPKDLAALEEIEAILLAVFRNPDEDFRTRQSAAMNVVKIVETKQKWASSLDAGDKSGAAMKQAQELLSELDDELRGKAESAFGTRRQETGVSGSH